MHFNAPSKGTVCGPGTLGIYFESTVDMSFNVIYLVDDQLWMTWHTYYFGNAALKYWVKHLAQHTEFRVKGFVDCCLHEPNYYTTASAEYF